MGKEGAKSVGRLHEGIEARKDMFGLDFADFCALRFSSSLLYFDFSSGFLLHVLCARPSLSSSLFRLRSSKSLASSQQTPLPLPLPPPFLPFHTRDISFPEPSFHPSSFFTCPINLVIRPALSICSLCLSRLPFVFRVYPLSNSSHSLFFLFFTMMYLAPCFLVVVYVLLLCKDKEVRECRSRLYLLVMVHVT